MSTRDFTATTFVVDAGRTLLLLHRKLARWLPPGGHIEPNELPHEAAVREVREETGLDVLLLTAAVPLGTVLLLPQPHCMLLEPISPGHEHIDLIYIATVVGGTLAPAAREALGARWFGPADLEAPEIGHDIRVLALQAIDQTKLHHSR